MHEAVEVIQVVGHATANTHMALGWKLLAVVPGMGGGGVPSVIYVLGKTGIKSDAYVDQEPVMPIMG
jgi:hypothetical protein